MRTIQGFSVALVLFCGLMVAAPGVNGADESGVTKDLSFAFVYLDDEQAASSFVELLGEHDLNTELVQLDDVPTTSFQQYNAVIVGSDIERAWSNAAANAIRDANVPVLGLGEGGYYFFGKLGLAIGSPHGWHGGEVAVRPVLSGESDFWSSLTFELLPNKELVLFAESPNVGIHLPNAVAGVVPIGQETGSDKHYSILQAHRRYVLWGFGASPEQMTTSGKQLFVHACRYVAAAVSEDVGSETAWHDKTESVSQEALIRRLQQLEARVAQLESRGPTPAAIDTPSHPFVGDWVNVEDRGPTRLEIRQTGRGQWAIRGWGDCEPTDCDWGTTPLHLLGESVAARELPYGLAIWDAGFKTRYMTLQLDSGELVATDFNVYKDGSGRTNFRRVEHFRRDQAATAARNSSGETSVLSRPGR